MEDSYLHITTKKIEKSLKTNDQKMKTILKVSGQTTKKLKQIQHEQHENHENVREERKKNNKEAKCIGIIVEKCQN